MKKLISLLRSCVIALGLTACGAGSSAPETTAPQEATFMAGFGRADITPGDGVGMGGYSDNETRLTKGTLDPLYVTCIAVTEGEETIHGVVVTFMVYEEIRYAIWENDGLTFSLTGMDSLEEDVAALIEKMGA